MRHELLDILHDPVKRITKATGLSRLWRKILFDKHISSSHAESLMQHYLNEDAKAYYKQISTENAVDGKTKPYDKSSVRNNLSSALAGADMSWKSLLRGMQFLRIKRFRLIAEITWANDSVSTHPVDIEFAQDDINNAESTVEES